MINWDQRNKNKDSFFAIQYKSKSQNQQRFYVKNVLEVRDKNWKLRSNELENLKRRYGISTNYQYQNNSPNVNNQNSTHQNGGNKKNYQNRKPRQPAKHTKTTTDHQQQPQNNQ